MSIINKVLKDLDRRGQQPFSKNAAGSAVEHPRHSRWLSWFWVWLLVILVIIIVGIAAIWWLPSDKQRMTLAEIEAHRVPEPDERVEPLVDTAAFTVPSELKAPTGHSSDRQPMQGPENLAVVVAPEPEQKPEGKQEPETAQVQTNTEEPAPEESPVVKDTKPETEKSGEFSKKLVQLSPAEIAEQHIEKAQKAQQQGRLTTAEEHWRKALAVTPENKEIRKKLAALQFGRNKVSQALLTLEEGFKLAPGDFEFRLLSARILEKEAREAAALSLLKQAIADAREYPEYVQKEALLAQQTGDYKSAAAAYQRLIEAEPAQGRWYLGKAVAQQAFAPQSALTSYQEALTRIRHRPTLEFIHQQIALLTTDGMAGEQ